MSACGPIEASKAAVCYVRNTSTPAVPERPGEGRNPPKAVDAATGDWVLTPVEAALQSDQMHSMAFIL
jgi:hypothetical protein